MLAKSCTGLWAEATWEFVTLCWGSAEGGASDIYLIFFLVDSTGSTRLVELCNCIRSDDMVAAVGLVVGVVCYPFWYSCWSPLNFITESHHSTDSLACHAHCSVPCGCFGTANATINCIGMRYSVRMLYLGFFCTNWF